MSKGSDLPVRLASAIALIALAFAALWVGGIGFWLVVSIGGVIMMGEWAGLAGSDARKRRLAQYAVSVPIAAMYFVAAGSPLAGHGAFLALGLIAAAFFFLVIVTRNLQLALGAFYVGLPVLSLIWLRGQEWGFLLTFWTMALVWACDSGAYFAGRLVGGPKLAPRISPNKTWAGLFGGIAGATLFGVALFYLTHGSLFMIYAAWWLAILSQMGDLFESHLKRIAGVKDSGTILPGHGGLLDRLDGLVPVAPAVVLQILINQAVPPGWWPF